MTQILTVAELKEIRDRHELLSCQSLEVLGADVNYLLMVLERVQRALDEAAFNEDYDPDDAIQALRDTGWEVTDAKTNNL